MTVIKLSTHINAPVASVFDLARSIDFHVQSASQTKERAIAGRTTGLISYGETVTWKGRHFGFFLKHSSKIVSFERPFQFTDVMIKGHFRYFAHQHQFHSENGKTVMVDVLKYKTPLGIVGRIFDILLLKNHLTRFLKKRNTAIKTRLENHAKESIGQ